MLTYVNTGQDNVFKDDLGYYSYDENIVIINLHNFTDTEENLMISDIMSTISHEYLHAVIWTTRKTYEDKRLFDFYEEKIIRNILGEKFIEEDYYELIQGEDLE